MKVLVNIIDDENGINFSGDLIDKEVEKDLMEFSKQKCNELMIEMMKKLNTETSSINPYLFFNKVLVDSPAESDYIQSVTAIEPLIKVIKYKKENNL